MATPLTIRKVLQAYLTDIRRWAQTVGAQTRVSRDPLHPCELLTAMGANQTLVVLDWGGDDALGESLLQPLCTHTLQVWIGQNRGLKAERDEAIFDAAGTELCLTDLVEEARKRVLSLAFPAEISRKRAKYAGTKPAVTPEGIPLAAYRITFTFDAAMETLDPRTAEV